MKKQTPDVDKCLQHIQQILAIRPDGMDFTDIIDTAEKLNLHDISTITPDFLSSLLNTESSNPDGSIILEDSKYILREQPSKTSPIPCRRRHSSPSIQISNPSKRSRIRSFSPSPSGPTGSPGSRMAYHLDRMNLDEDTDSAEEASWRILSSPRPRRRRVGSPNTSPQGSPSRHLRGRPKEISSEFESVQIVFPSSSPPSTPPPSTSYIDESTPNSFDSIDTPYPSPSSPQQKKERRVKRAEQLRKFRAREAREAREDRARKRNGEAIEEVHESNGKKVGFAMEDIKVFVYEGEDEEEEEGEDGY